CLHIPPEGSAYEGKKRIPGSGRRHPPYRTRRPDLVGPDGHLRDAEPPAGGPPLRDHARPGPLPRRDRPDRAADRGGRGAERRLRAALAAADPRLRPTG